MEVPLIIDVDAEHSSSTSSNRIKKFRHCNCFHLIMQATKEKKNQPHIIPVRLYIRSSELGWFNENPDRYYQDFLESLRSNFSKLKIESTSLEESCNGQTEEKTQKKNKVNVLVIGKHLKFSFEVRPSVLKYTIMKLKPPSLSISNEKMSPIYKGKEFENIPLLKKTLYVWIYKKDTIVSTSSALTATSNIENFFMPVEEDEKVE